MKFTNGYWMDRAGYAVRKARGLRDLNRERRLLLRLHERRQQQTHPKNQTANHDALPLPIKR